jgi:hypothetical protein
MIILLVGNLHHLANNSAGRSWPYCSYLGDEVPVQYSIFNDNDD